MGSAPLLDCAGRRRSPATFPGHHQGRPPRYKGLQYPPDPPTIEEIIAVMRVAGETPDGLRLRGLVVVLWRAGLRISEALALTESDLDAARGAILLRHGYAEFGIGRVMPSHALCRLSALGGQSPQLSAISGRQSLGIILVVRGRQRCAEPAGSRMGRGRTAAVAREGAHAEDVALHTRAGPHAVWRRLTVTPTRSRNPGRRSRRAPCGGAGLCRASRAPQPAEYSNARIDSAQVGTRHKQGYAEFGIGRA